MDVGPGAATMGLLVLRRCPGGPEDVPLVRYTGVVEKEDEKARDNVRYSWFVSTTGCTKLRAPSTLTQDSSGSVSARSSLLHPSSVPHPFSSSEESTDAGFWVLSGHDEAM